MKNNYCNICPRNCNVNRSTIAGFCGQSNKIFISKVMLHKYEEPCISGEQSCTRSDAGSGAIFFSGCNLKCIYCQNHEISQAALGKEVSIDGLVNIFKQLESAGALNINLVTPTHYTKQIIESLKIYKPQIPIIWNSSGYEKPEIIKSLKGLVDVFLIDFKYFSSDLARELSLASNYPEFAKKSIKAAKSICKTNKFNKNGNITSGLIIRHLCLPNCTNDSKDVLSWIKENIGNETIVSIMSQYVPMHKAKAHPLINRKLKPIEYKSVISHAKKLGFNNAYIQELSSSNSIYTPNFSEKSQDFIY